MSFSGPLRTRPYHPLHARPYSPYAYAPTALTCTPLHLERPADNMGHVIRARPRSTQTALPGISAVGGQSIFPRKFIGAYGAAVLKPPGADRWSMRSYTGGPFYEVRIGASVLIQSMETPGETCLQRRYHLPEIRHTCPAVTPTPLAPSDYESSPVRTAAGRSPLSNDADPAVRIR
jgi:hypothetical protein